MGRARIEQAARDRWQGGQMEDQLAISRRRLQDGRVNDAAVDEVDVRGRRCQVVCLAGAEVVDYANLPAVACQLIDEMRTDEPGAAGDETLPHRASLRSLY